MPVYINGHNFGEILPGYSRYECQNEGCDCAIPPELALGPVAILLDNLSPCEGEPDISGTCKGLCDIRDIWNYDPRGYHRAPDTRGHHPDCPELKAMLEKEKQK